MDELKQTLGLVLRCFSPGSLSCLHLSCWLPPCWVPSFFYPNAPCALPKTFALFLLAAWSCVFLSCWTVSTCRAGQCFSQLRLFHRRGQSPGHWLNLTHSGASSVNGRSGTSPTTFLLQAPLEAVENPQAHIPPLGPLSRSWKCPRWN